MVNKTVELVKYWGAFEQQYPEGSIDDFCRHHLVHQREKENGQLLVGSFIPSITEGLLLKMIGRIARLASVYANRALQGTGLEQIDEFALLAAVKQMEAPKKTEIIYQNLHELSSGTDMLNRLIKKGYVAETVNIDDKRSKILQLTESGGALLLACRERIAKMAMMLTKEMPADDKQLCIQLLKNMEIKFSGRWMHDKAKSFEEIYEELMGVGNVK